MGDIKFYCQHCGQHIEAPEDMLGQQSTCPACNAAITVPQPRDPVIPPKDEGNEPAPPMADTPEQPRYSGAWRRFFAFVLDNCIVEAAYGIFMLVFGTVFATLLSGNLLLAALLPIALVRVLCLNWLYFALMESSPQRATFGKQIFGILVQHVSGERISFWRATARHFAPTVFLVPVVVASIIQIVTGSLDIGVLVFLSVLPAAGYLWIVKTPRKQSVYDIWTKCVVVHKQPDTGKLHNLSPLRTALLITGVVVVSSMFTMVNSNAMPDDPMPLRLLAALLASLLYAWIVFLLVFFVKRSRNRKKNVQNNGVQPAK